MIELEGYTRLREMHVFKFAEWSCMDYMVYSHTESIEIYSSDCIMFPSADIVFTYYHN